jgi:iron-sulfur cluster repair di-iron protein
MHGSLEQSPEKVEICTRSRADCDLQRFLRRTGEEGNPRRLVEAASLAFSNRSNILTIRVGVHGKNHPELLQVQQLFAALAEELRVHLMKEEQMLFPYISLMEESAFAGEPAPPAMFGTVANPVRMMMQEHDGAGEALRALRSVTTDYKVPEDACITYRTLYGTLESYEADLHQHIHLENNILFPRAIAMEAKR